MRRFLERWGTPTLSPPPRRIMPWSLVSGQRREESPMLKQIEGSHATAEAIALCRPEVICAYPITPQTHIVEGLGEMVRLGELKNCEFINVESE
ncbi:MAG: hypothetical protein WBM16_18465, partial [Pseudolabrys sp.]